MKSRTSRLPGSSACIVSHVQVCFLPWVSEVKRQLTAAHHAYSSSFLLLSLVRGFLSGKEKPAGRARAAEQTDDKPVGDRQVLLHFTTDFVSAASLRPCEQI
jgi:hypothetical protein